MTFNLNTGVKIRYVFENDAEDDGKIIKADGNWRRIQWTNGVKTWLRTERLEERVIAKLPAVKVKTRMEPRKAAEVPPKATKPRPARKAPGKTPEALRDMLSLEPSGDRDWADADADKFFG